MHASRACSRLTASFLQCLHRPSSTANPQLFDFLTPSLRSCSRPKRITTSTAPPSTEPKPKSLESPSSAKRRKPLSAEQRAFLDSALRVNQAGELAATLIYTAQTPSVTRREPHLRPLMQHMYDQEAGHFATFNAMLAKHRIRPTALYPVWQVAATALGWTTGMMGREAAMACTEAVETEIGGHYNGQVRVLLAWMRDMEDRGEVVGAELTELVRTLKRIRDEELEHLDEAVGQDAQLAGGYAVLNRVIRGGCKGAIWLSERF